MAASIGLFAVFAWYEVRRQRSGRDALIEPSVFHKRPFSGGLVVGLVFFSGMTGFSLVFSLYCQIGLHYSPLKAGLAGIPWSIGMIVGFGLAQAVQKYGRKVIHGGTAIMASGFAGVELTLPLARGRGTRWHVLPALTLPWPRFGPLTPSFRL